MSVNIIEKIKSLTEELKHYAWAYYQNDAPEITDAEYDAKCDELRSLEDKENFWLADSPTRKVQGALLDSLKKVKHPVPMLSADKSVNRAGIFLQFLSGELRHFHAANNISFGRCIIPENIL